MSRMHLFVYCLYQLHFPQEAFWSDCSILCCKKVSLLNSGILWRSTRILQQQLMVSNALFSHVMNVDPNRRKWVPSPFLVVSHTSCMFQGVLKLPGCGSLNFGHSGKNSHFPALSVFTKTPSSQILPNKCIIYRQHRSWFVPQLFL